MYDEMQNATNIKVLNLLTETANYIKEKEYKKVAIFGSRSTRDLGLYDFLDPIKATDEEQDMIDKLIENVMYGTQSEDHKYLFRRMIDEKYQNGAEAVILGCTELPLLVNQSETYVPLINTTEILAMKLTKEILE
jgi:aspartate racemase